MQSRVDTLYIPQINDFVVFRENENGNLLVGNVFDINFYFLNSKIHADVFVKVTLEFTLFSHFPKIWHLLSFPFSRQVEPFDIFKQKWQCYFQATLNASLQYCAEKLPVSLLDLVEKLLNDARWNYFKYEIGEYSYSEIIPYPIYFNLIYQRLLNNYYRSIRSFLFDLKHIFYNSLRFNGYGSSLYNLANELMTFIREELEILGIEM